MPMTSATAAATATAEPTPSVTPTPGTCLVVPEEYCGKAVIVVLGFTTAANAATLTWVGLSVPAGTPIFAPASGTMSERAKEPMHDAAGPEIDLPLRGILVGPTSSPTAAWTLVVSPVFAPLADTDVKEGAIVATASDAPIVGSYNVLVAYAAAKGANLVLDVTHLEAIFGLP
jgi:hypothetical protein